MEYKRYRVSKTLKPSVENVLNRRAIRHQFVEAGDEIYCLLKISNTQFHKIIIRAKMEQYERERGFDERGLDRAHILARCECYDSKVIDEISSSCAYFIYEDMSPENKT